MIKNKKLKSDLVLFKTLVNTTMMISSKQEIKITKAQSYSKQTLETKYKLNKKTPTVKLNKITIKWETFSV